MNNKFAVGMLAVLLTLTGSVGYFSYTYLINEDKNQAMKKDQAEDTAKQENEEAEEQQEADAVEPSEQENDTDTIIDEGNQTVSDALGSSSGTETARPDGKTTVTVNNNYEVPKEKLDHIQEVIHKVHPQTKPSNPTKPSDSQGSSSSSNQGSNESNQGNQGSTTEKPSVPDDTANNQNQGNTVEKPDVGQTTEPEIIYDRTYVAVLVSSLKKDLVTISERDATNKEFNDEICYQATVRWKEDLTRSYVCWVGSRTLNIYDENGEEKGTVYSDLNQFFE